MGYYVTCTPVQLQLNMDYQKQIKKYLQTEIQRCIDNTKELFGTVGVDMHKAPTDFTECFKFFGFEILNLEYNSTGACVYINRIEENKLTFLDGILDYLTPYMRGKIIMVGEDEQIWVEHFENGERFQRTGIPERFMPIALDDTPTNNITTTKQKRKLDLD